MAGLGPHVTTVVDHADNPQIASPTSVLMNELGQLLKAKALCQQAELLMQRALAIDEQS